jgi:hypothetical protein
MELYSPGVVKYTNGGAVYIYSVETIKVIFMNDNQWFLMFIGLIFIAICVGNIFTIVYGFLTFGIGLILTAFLNRLWSKKKG